MNKLILFAMCFLIAFIVEMECEYKYLIVWEFFNYYSVRFRYLAVADANITFQFYSHTDTKVLQHTTYTRFYSGNLQILLFPYIKREVPLHSMIVNSSVDFEILVVLLNVKGAEVVGAYYPLEVTKMSNIYVFPVTEVINSILVVTDFDKVEVDVITYYSDHLRSEEESIRHFFLIRHLATSVDFSEDKDNRWRTSGCRLEANEQVAVFLVVAKPTPSGVARYPIEPVKPPDAYDTSWKSLDLHPNFRITGTYHIMPGLSSTVVGYRKPGRGRMVKVLEEGEVLKIDKSRASDVELQVETTASSPAIFVSSTGGFIGVFTPALKRVYKMHFMTFSYLLPGKNFRHYFQVFPDKKEGFLLKMDGINLYNYAAVDVSTELNGTMLEANIKFGVMAFGTTDGAILYYHYGVNPRLVVQDFDRARLKSRSKNFTNSYYRFVCPITKYGENCTEDCKCPESHCIYTGACYSRKCQTGTFGPRCENEDLSVFNTETYLSPWMDSDGNTCEEISNTTIAVNLKYKFRVSKINLALKADIEANTAEMVESVYVEHTQTKEMVEVDHFTVSPGSVLPSVDIVLDRDYMTRRIRIRFTSVNICTLSIDGGVNVASSETVLFSTPSLNNERLKCLHDGDRHAACLIMSEKDRVDIEFKEKMAIKRLAIYSTVSTKPWTLLVRLADTLVGLESDVKVEGGDALFNFVHVSIMINKIHLELESGQVALCEIEMYTDGGDTSTTGETVSKEQTTTKYSVGAVHTNTTPQRRASVAFSQQEDSPEGTVHVFVLPLILALYCLVHIATVVFVAMEAKRQALEEPSKKDDADVQGDADAATQDAAAARDKRKGKRRIVLPRKDRAVEHEV
ncbi:uncharacterized protein LOC131951058 [Physella acuta]|uniref:uncharacterized protein LOC131951058 n=1 Tax=Physella acuta TaxID=109671 RepID=UPI0027DD2078|nr:uncharacterized protein LOC131951058 [Physella acuta]